ncbi:hypothetical protein NFI96_009586, partial [Prochilodus magdalenae]
GAIKPVPNLTALHNMVAGTTELVPNLTAVPNAPEGSVKLAPDPTVLPSVLEGAVKPLHHEPRYILYINLVINDILMICISVTMYVLTYACPYVNVSFCCVLLTLGSTTYMNTPVILAGMAIERYIAVCKPLHHSQICTVNRTYILICVIWGIGAIPAVIDVIIVVALQPASYFNSLTYCQPIILYSSKYNLQKAIATQILYMALVWIALFYTYFKVLFTAKTASSDHRQSSAKKARNTILLHGGQLLLCMLSYVAPVLDFMLIPFFPAHRTKITFFNYLLTNIVPRLLSPLIYGVRDQKFVRHIKRYFSFRLTGYIPPFENCYGAPTKTSQCHCWTENRPPTKTIQSAASCGQRPVTTGEGIEYDQHCTMTLTVHLQGGPARNPVFYTDTRYILYVHLVVNDIIMLCLSITLHVLVYTVPLLNVAVCSVLLLLAKTTGGNTALNLAGMALERYIAICKPLHHPQLCSVTRAYILIGLIWTPTGPPQSRYDMGGGSFSALQ